MPTPKLTFYIDIVSPFAYQAYHILRNSPSFSQVQITYLPVFLGGIMKATSNTPPINIKNKAEYIGAQRDRHAAQFSIPMKKGNVPNFPPMTLYLMRVLAALALLDAGAENTAAAQVAGSARGQESAAAQALLCRAVDALWAAFWTEHADISDKNIYEKIIARAVGDEKCARAVELAATEGKQLLLDNTQRAIKDGAFGLPWMLCENAAGEKVGFWGVDQVGQVCGFLGLQRPEQGGWKSVL